MELAVDLGECEADAVAVGEGRGWVELKRGQREAGGFEVRAELSGFVAELRRVGEVLELAAAARTEVRAAGSGTVFAVADRVVVMEVQGIRFGAVLDNYFR